MVFALLFSLILSCSLVCSHHYGPFSLGPGEFESFLLQYQPEKAYHIESRCEKCPCNVYVLNSSSYDLYCSRGLVVGAFQRYYHSFSLTLQLGVAVDGQQDYVVFAHSNFSTPSFNCSDGEPAILSYDVHLELYRISNESVYAAVFLSLLSVFVVCAMLCVAVLVVFETVRYCRKKKGLDSALQVLPDDNEGEANPLLQDKSKSGRRSKKGEIDGSQAAAPSAGRRRGPILRVPNVPPPTIVVTPPPNEVIVSDDFVAPLDSSDDDRPERKRRPRQPPTRRLLWDVGVLLRGLGLAFYQKSFEHWRFHSLFRIREGNKFMQEIDRIFTRREHDKAMALAALRPLVFYRSSTRLPKILCDNETLWTWLVQHVLGDVPSRELSRYQAYFSREKVNFAFLYERRRTELEQVFHQPLAGRLHSELESYGDRNLDRRHVKYRSLVTRLNRERTFALVHRICEGPDAKPPSEEPGSI